MENYTTHIKSKTGWFDVDFKELYRYKDLVYLFFKRNYTTTYKQTILGPLWLILNPLLTVSLYALVFGSLAGLAAEETPQFVFYLCSNALWSFFSSSLIQTANTFTANAAIMGKVYFPRLVMPMSSVLTGMLQLGIQLFMLILIMLSYYLFGDIRFNLTYTLFLSPFIILQTGILGLACGIIIAACTTKYRDLVILVNFGVSLWMYATPVVYTSELVPDKFKLLYMLNPMAPIIESFRHAVLGIGVFPWFFWMISLFVTFLVLFIGILLFSRIEKTFMDTV